MILDRYTHRRLNILTGEWVLVSPHRAKRPWQGKIEAIYETDRKKYAEKCYLCPGNKRADGVENEKYTAEYVFTNDFSALINETPVEKMNKQSLLIAETQSGICKVIVFSPNHSLSLAEMEADEILNVVNTWQKEFMSISKNNWIKYIQIFENKGEIMGCSNPHPHGQIWATGDMPTEIMKETFYQHQYYHKNGRSLLSDYVDLELREKVRIILENEYFVALVPFWAVWPYETMIISKRHVPDITKFTPNEKKGYAEILRKLLIKYDNLFSTSFPYSAGMHQRPVNNGKHEEWHWHMHLYPPLLRNATVKKFMVGFEMLCMPQRDITPEMSAETLRSQNTKHYKCKLK